MTCDPEAGTTLTETRLFVSQESKGALLAMWGATQLLTEGVSRFTEGERLCGLGAPSICATVVI